MKKAASYSILIFGLLFAVSAFAEIDNNPCKADRETFCSQCKPEDKTCVKECMKINETKLSQMCQAHRAAQKVNNK